MRRPLRPYAGSSASVLLHSTRRNGTIDVDEIIENTLSKHGRSLEIEAPRWQKCFFDHLIRSPESPAEKWKYGYENPVRAGLVAKAEDGPYAGKFLANSWL
jgi:hypothetical protein